jgi:AraC-like DNA-binding protein
VSCLQFNLRSIADFIEATSGLGFAGLVRASAGAPVKICGTAGKNIRTMLLSFPQDDAAGGNVSLSRAFETLTAVSSILARGMAGMDESMAQVSTEPRIRGIMKTISDMADGPLSLDDIARRCALSKAYLCRLFKRCTHMTVQQYLTHVRISRAKHLLRDKGRNVTQACFESGFSSPSYFISVFSRIAGVTPKQWAKGN